MVSMRLNRLQICWTASGLIRCTSSVVLSGLPWLSILAVLGPILFVGVRAKLALGRWQVSHGTALPTLHRLGNISF